MMAAVSRLTPGVVAFTTKAPTAIAGHSRRDPSSSAARASPVGGQTSVTLWPTVATLRPSFASAT